MPAPQTIAVSAAAITTTTVPSAEASTNAAAPTGSASATTATVNNSVSSSGRHQLRPVKYDYADSFACTYIVSVVAASVAELATYPLDLTKTRLQIQGEAASVAAIASTANATSSVTGGAKANVSTLHIFRYIFCCILLVFWCLLLCWSLMHAIFVILAFANNRYPCRSVNPNRTTSVHPLASVDKRLQLVALCSLRG